jgi:hypothetical protein
LPSDPRSDPALFSPLVIIAAANRDTMASPPAMAAIPVEYIVQRYFGYAPSHAGAVAGLAIFATLALASGTLTLWTRAHCFMLIVALTAALEAGGYVSRLVCMTKPSLAPFAAMQVGLAAVFSSRRQSVG